ncbi:MAG: vancomycin resistance protein YoaR [Myxococcota bacterium]
MTHSTPRFAVQLAAVASLIAAGCTAPLPARRTAQTDGARAVHRTAEPAWVQVGAFTTQFDLEAADRVHNVTTAATRLDGLILKAGRSWSFNAAVGRRTLEGGWKLAPTLVLEGARLDVGGGICQVSTTVYNAALFADLKVEQRHPHSRPIRYVPLGRDATVSWGTKDLVLSNPHPFPIRFEAFVNHDRLTVRALAPRALAYEVRLESGNAEPATPRKELQVLAEPDRLAVGGLWVKLYRHRVRDGSIYETERVGGSSFYPYRIVPPLSSSTEVR